MCGIGAIFDKESLKYDQCIRAFSSLNKRGPDHNGYWLSADKTAMLYHTRLAIIGLTNSGNQPLVCCNNRYVMIYNGEIYNYKKLAKSYDLKHNNHTSDSEILFKLWILQGKKILSELRGMFSIVFYDSYRKKVIAVRDPLGIKPLYYYKDSSKLILSSDLLSIRKLVKCVSVNKQSVISYLIHGSILGNDTLIKGVEKVTPGNYIIYDKCKHVIEKHQYWDLKAEYKKSVIENRNLNRFDVADKIHEVISNSFKDHCVSDVPIALYLSGGCDSSILGFLCKIHNIKACGLTYTNWNNCLNEHKLAQETAQRFNIDHKVFMIDSSGHKNKFLSWLPTIQNPTTDGFNSYIISSICNQNGYKVALSGIGGDELFGGYHAIFNAFPKLHRSARIMPSILKRLIRLYLNPRKGIYQNKISKALDIIKENELEKAYFSCRQLFSKDYVNEQLNINLDNSFGPLSLFGSKERFFTDIDKLILLEITRYLQPQLLQDIDHYNMVNSVETRTPFVDKVVFESLAGINHKYFKQNKKLIKNAFPMIPRGVSQGQKKGFFVDYTFLKDESFREILHSGFLNVNYHDESIFDNTLTLLPVIILYSALNNLGLNI